MKLTLSRSLIVLVALGVPLAAGGAYLLSSPKEPVAKRKPAPCACCQTPTGEQLVMALAEGETSKSDCPMFGGTPQRNMVNLVDKNVPTDWSVEDGKLKNVKWTAVLGDKAYGGPIVANGRVYVGTNNGTHRDLKKQRSVLMAFNEADGKPLWKIEHPALLGDAFRDGATEGLCSTPVVEGDGVFYVTPAAEVVRASALGKVVWTYDMMKELGVVPFHLANCSPVIVGDHVLVITGNGIDGEGNVVSPKAPSFIAVHKQTGKLVWQSALPGDKIIQGQWTNPCVAVVGGKPQAIFPGGDGVIYSLEPETGKLIWRFDCHPNRPKAEAKGEKEIINYFISTPVVHDNKLYLGMGVGPDLGHTTKFSYLFCIDVTKTGDVSPKSFDAADPANKESALIWAHGGLIVPRPKSGRAAKFSSTMSTCAVHDGYVYAAEEIGIVHCLDAKTGQPYWFHDLQAAIWGSPYYVDGKVYLGSETQSVTIFAHGKAKKVVAEIEMGEILHSTPIVANGTLYVATKSRLYAIEEKK